MQSTFYIPDVMVTPATFFRDLLRAPAPLEAYSEPLPLVVEVWAPSTGTYDVDEKLPEYQRRGDREIWRLHPYERTLTAWQRGEHGEYASTAFTAGIIQPIAFPSVTIDLDALFRTLELQP